MNPPGKERWARLWRETSCRGDAAEWFDDLAERHAQPHRHYHNGRHLAECLAGFDAARQFARHPAAVELALWFHDAVYDPQATDNEEQSARLAERCLARGGAGSELRTAVTALVLATKTQDATQHVDAPLVVDVDLSIFGQPEDRFWEYEAQIRREYDWVPAASFAAKRAEVLERFLARGRIYATDHFHQRHEAQARLNLQSSLRRLRH
jgi:predicted metal-dependent HD superfamily phosphohydrolase